MQRPAISARSRQRWWRPEPATAIFAALLAGGLLVANLLGYVVVEPDIAPTTGGLRELTQCETRQAGWPWPYLAVHGDSLVPLADLEDSLDWASPLAVAGDLLAGLLVAGSGGLVLGWWWRGRRGCRQFGLRDLTLATALVGIALAGAVLPAMRSHGERRALHDMAVHVAEFGESQRMHRCKSVVWQPGRLAWLRPLVGDSLPLGDSVVGLTAYSGDIPHVARLPRLRALRLHGTTTDRELAKLAPLPRLETLDLCDVVLRQDRNGWLAKPSVGGEYPLALRWLRRLYARGNVLQGSDLAGLASLEEADLAETVVDRESAAVLGGLASLRILDLHDTALDDHMLAELAHLPNLEMLDVSGTKVTDAGAAHLAHLPRLAIVWVARTSVTDRGLARLAACPRLGSVRVTGSSVTRGGLVAFRRARPGCTVLP